MAPNEPPSTSAIIAIRRQPKLPRHYVVTYGTAQSKVQVIDFPLPPHWVDFDLLSERWDGAALLVSADEQKLEIQGIHRSFWSSVVLFGEGFVLIGLAWWYHAKKYRPTMPSR